MRILDKYLIKRYLKTFFFTLFILIPIALAIDVSEKIDKFLRYPNLTFMDVVRDYYVNFIVYYANTFMPLALFISVVWFTAQMAKKTEIVAITTSRISFNRFLRPYLIGATIVAIFSLYMNHFVVPNSNAALTNFEHRYIYVNQGGSSYVENASLKLKKGHYIFMENFGFKTNRGTNFSYEKYDGLKLKYRITADDIRWDAKKEQFKVEGIRKRYLFHDHDSIVRMESVDTIFGFTPKDLLHRDYLAKEFISPALVDFIDVSTERGVKNLNAYKVELHKRTSLPISSYILTIIAVCVAFKKRRGGTGLSMAIGIALMFIYVFFMKISEVLGATAGGNTLLMVWIPNLVFSTIAVGLYFRAIR